MFLYYALCIFILLVLKALPYWRSHNSSSLRLGKPTKLTNSNGIHYLEYKLLLYFYTFSSVNTPEHKCFYRAVSVYLAFAKH